MYQKLVVTLFVLTSLLTINPQNDMFNLAMGYSGLWLIILYIYGAYFKRFGVPHVFTKKLNLIFLIMAIMPSKYTDEIENASDTWRVFLYGKKIKIFTPAKVNYYQ